MCNSIRLPYPETAHIVRTTFDLYATGNNSVLAIKRNLYEAYALHIGTSKLEAILKNPFYNGQMLVKSKLYPHKYERLVDERVFEQVEAVRKGYAVQPRRYGGLPYQYRGLISRDMCGCRITFERKKGKYIYGHCTQFKGKYKANYVQESEFTKQLAPVFERIAMPQDKYEEVRSKLQDAFLNENQNKIDEIRLVDTEISKYQKRLDRIYEDHIDGKIPEDFYQRKFTEYTENVKKLERRKSTFELPANDRFKSVDYLLQLSKNAPDLFKSADIEGKRGLIKLVISKLQLQGNLLRWELKKPYDLMAFCSISGNWLPIQVTELLQGSEDTKRDK